MNENNYDTLLLKMNGTYYRNMNGRVYQGRWATSPDSTRLIVLPANPMQGAGDAIQELTDSTLQLTRLLGKEGETVITRYRQQEIK